MHLSQGLRLLSVLRWCLLLQDCVEVGVLSQFCGVLCRIWPSDHLMLVRSWLLDWILPCSGECICCRDCLCRDLTTTESMHVECI